jgi:hypothetical protein
MREGLVPQYPQGIGSRTHTDIKIQECWRLSIKLCLHITYAQPPVYFKSCLGHLQFLTRCKGYIKKCLYWIVRRIMTREVCTRSVQTQFFPNIFNWLLVHRSPWRCWTVDRVGPAVSPFLFCGWNSRKAQNSPQGTQSQANHSMSASRLEIKCGIPKFVC